MSAVPTNGTSHNLDLHQLTTELAIRSAELSAAAKNHAILENEIGFLRQQLRDLCAQLGRLQEQPRLPLAAAKPFVTVETEELNRRPEDSRDLRQDLEVLRVALTQAERLGLEQRTRLEAECNRLRAELKRGQERLDDLTRTNAENQELIGKLRLEVENRPEPGGNLEPELASLRASLARAKEQTQAEQHRYQTALDEWKDRVGAAQKCVLAQREDWNEEIAKERENWRLREEQLRGRLAAATQELQAAAATDQQAVVSLREEVANVTAALAGCRKREDEAKQHNLEMARQARTLQSELAQHRTWHADARQQLAVLENQLQEARNETSAERQQIERILADQRASSDSQRAHWQAQVDQARQQMEEERQTLRDEHEVLKSLADRFRRQATALRQALEETGVFVPVP